MATEGKQVPVVVSHADAGKQSLRAVRLHIEARASVVANPGNDDVLLLTDPELLQSEAGGPPHPWQRKAEEVGVAGPGEGLGAAADEEGVGDRVAGVDRREHRFEGHGGTTRAIDFDRVSGENSRVAGLEIERQVDKRQAPVGRWQRQRHTCGRLPPFLSLDLPAQPRGRTGGEFLGGPFDPGKGSDDGATAEGGCRERDAVAADIEQHATERIGGVAGCGTVDLKSARRRECLEPELLDCPDVAGD